MSAHKILKEGSLNKVRSGGWGTNKRWFVLFREVGSSTHSLVYFKNEAARKANFSQPAGVYAVKLIKAVRARDKDDPKNVGVSIYFKSTTPASPSSPASPSKNSEETKGEQEADVVASKEADKPSEDKPTEPATDSAETSAEKPTEKSPEKAAEKSPGKEKPSKEAGGHAEKTFMLLEADNKAEADAWIAALVKAHSEEGTIPQQVLLQEETEKLRENRAKKEKDAEGAAKIEGELRKLKQSNKLGIGAWQTRFFSLDAEFFSYYKSSKKGEPLGYFPVTQMVCVGTSPLQENTCFFFRLPATFSTGDGKYLKTGAPMSPSAAASDGEEDKKSDKADGKAKDVIILLRCNTTAERDRWIQAFVDLGVKKAMSKDKPEAKPDAKADEQGDAKSETKAESKPEASPEVKPETSPEAKPEASPEAKPDASTDSSSSSSSSSPAPLPVEGD